MNLYCIKCLKCTNNNNIRIKDEINREINLYSQGIDCVVTKFETIEEKDLNNLLKIYVI